MSHLGSWNTPSAPFIIGLRTSFATCFSQLPLSKHFAIWQPSSMVTTFPSPWLPNFSWSVSPPLPHQLELIRKKYVVWGALRDDPHLSEYYMSRGQVVLLRGADYSDECVVCEESVVPIKIGLGRNIFPPTVIRKIAEMRSNSR